MSLTYSPSFWNSFLDANPSFAGFGKLTASVCILNDAFLAAKDTDELEVMFQLERVNRYWKEKMEEEPTTPSFFTYLPDYCHHYLDSQLQIHKLNLAKESCFFVPLTIDFYYQNEQVWKDKLKKKLLAYQPLLSSFSQVYFASRFIEEEDFRSILPNTLLHQLHFRQATQA